MDDRTNSYVATFPSPEEKRIYCEFAASSDACYNEINYRRHEAYFDPNGNVYKVDLRDLREKYVPVIGSGTFDQLERKNRGQWRSYFDLDGKYERGELADEPGLPGYWGNRSDGYPLFTLIRNDLYEIEWDGDRSTIQFTIGKALKEKYDYGGNQRLRLNLKGVQRWQGKDCQLQLWYDETYDVVRVRHPVKQPTLTVHAGGQTYTPSGNATTPSQATTAAIDVGANNTFSVVTDAGDALVFNARSEFTRFQSISTHIADLQSNLPDGVYTSERIERRYDDRRNRRDHHHDAAVRHLVEWLDERGVEEVIVGDLTDVLSTHWSVTVNTKTHAFWSHGVLCKRLSDVFEEVDGMRLREESEAGSSSTCPCCGATGEAVDRDGDDIRCLDCEFDGHADVVGAVNLLVEQSQASFADVFGPMARPTARGAERTRGDDPNLGVTHLQWNDHSWTPVGSGERGGQSTNEASVNP
ncbi:transposase [Natronococcus pandeyae]|nr:transposase [Natronococcus pandeyae]